MNDENQNEEIEPGVIVLAGLAALYLIIKILSFI